MATAQTQISCPIFSPFASSLCWVGGKLLDSIFGPEDDSHEIQNYEDKSANAKHTTCQTHTSCPIGYISDIMVKLTVKMLKTMLKYIFDFEIVLRLIQIYMKNLRRTIFNIVSTLLFKSKIYVIETLDYICLIIYVDNNNAKYTNNYIRTNSNNLYTNSDINNSSCNSNNINYNNNCDSINIEDNYDNYEMNIYRFDRNELEIDNNAQVSHTAISKESECEENISDIIPSVSETVPTISNNFDQRSIEYSGSVPSSTNSDHTLLPTNQFISFVSKVETQEDIDDELALPFSYQYMFDKRTSPWEMKDWNYEELNNFAIEPEKIDRLYHMVADDEDQNFRSWEISCRMEYRGEKYFVEMYANCDYTGFDCQGGGHISITKLPDFFLENMVTMDQNPDKIYKSLREDGYNVQEPDLLHKVHPKFWNNAPMLKYLCHNAIYKHRDVLPHFKDELPKILAKSVDDFIIVKDWDNEWLPV